MVGWRGRLARDVIGTARQLAASGLTHGTTGNVSGRLADRVLITPTRAPYAKLRPRQLVELATTGERIRGGQAPSTETTLHLAIYARRPDVRAVVHAHGPAAVSWGLMGRPLPTYLEESSYYGLGIVDTVEEAEAGSARLAQATAAALDHAEAALLMSHGLIAVGESLEEALNRALAVEHVCRVALAVAAGSHATATTNPALGLSVHEDVRRADRSRPRGSGL